MSYLRRSLAILVVGLVASACTWGSPGSSVSVDASPETSPSQTAMPTPSPAPGVVATLYLAFRPSGIVFADDTLWAEDHAQTNVVYGIDPETGTTITRVPLRRPCDLAYADGLIWVPDLDTGEILSIEPSSGEVTTRASDLAGPCGPVAMGGAIWFAVDTGLARLDPTTDAVTTTTLERTAFPGTGRPLWVSMYGAAQVGRVDLETGDVSRITTIPGGAARDTPVASGHGSVWVGHGATNRVYRLDPLTGAIEAEIEVTQPTRLLVTEAAVWLTSYDGGVVERIDPETNEVDFHTELAGTPNGIAEGVGAIWVSDTSSGRVYRIDPNATSAGG